MKHSASTTAAQPTHVQKAWLDLQFGMFIHFGINTYYDREWSYGDLDPAKFYPSQLDTDQWCRTARQAGMKYIVLVTKHIDGFCLWHSALTSYSVAATPCRKDIVAELVNSAHKYGLKVGFYYALWDNHQKDHDTDEPAYNQFVRNQIQELLSRYGQVVEIWLDGFWKKQQHGWTKKQKNIGGEAGFQEKNHQRDLDFAQAWRKEGAYRWEIDYLYSYIKTLQPDCLVMNNSTTAYPGVPLHPVDARCAEKGQALENDQKTWNWLGKNIYLPLQIETTLSVKGNEQFPSGNWFWHEWDKSVATKKDILRYRKTARKMNANLLLNCGIMANGKLRPQDEKLLLSLSE